MTQVDRELASSRGQGTAPAVLGPDASPAGAAPAEASLAQNPKGSEDGLWDWWSGLAAEPALVEFFIVLVLGVLVLLFHLRMSRLVRDARSRAAVKDYLLGVEQALAGDFEGAKQRLEKVLIDDPENHHARLLLGETLAELGEPAEAHKHHLFLQRAFEVQSERNDLDLARSLLDAGRTAEAVEAARRATGARPDQRPALELLFAAEQAAGFPEDAGRTGGRLARILTDEAHRQRVLARAAASLALAGTVRWQAGDLEAARDLCEEAAQLDAGCPENAHLRARLDYAERGQQAIEALLVDQPEHPVPGLTLPAPTAPQLPSVGEPVERTALPAVVSSAAAAAPGTTPTTGDTLVPAATYRCRMCGAGVAVSAAICPHCTSEGSVEPSEPALLHALESPSVIADDIDANRTHVRRQLARALDQDPDAMDDLVGIGADAVEELLAAAGRRGTSGEALVQVLQRMGPSVLPSLFDAYTRLKERPLRNLQNLLRPGDETSVMGRVVQGYGREALQYFEGQLQTRDRDLRKVIIDYFIGLGDQLEFRKILEHFPPVEVIHRLNAGTRQSLLPLLSTAEPGGFLADGLLLEPIYHREEEVLLAIEHAADASVLVTVLQRRGYSARLTEVLVDHLAGGPLATHAGHILDSYGTAALEHLLLAFADPDRSDAVRGELSRRITGMGPPVVGKVCGLFGPAASSLDDHVHGILVAIGPPAADSLAEAYDRTSLLEKLGSGLVNRYNHRRAAIVRSLAAVGARVVLQRLRHQESDPNLKLRLSQALQNLDNPPAAPAPETGAAEGQPKAGASEEPGFADRDDDGAERSA